MKRVLKIIGIVVVVILLAVIALPFLVNVNSFRPNWNLNCPPRSPPGQSRQSQPFHLVGSVSAEDLSISDDPAFSKGSIYSG